MTSFPAINSEEEYEEETIGGEEVLARGGEVGVGEGVGVGVEGGEGVGGE